MTDSTERSQTTRPRGSTDEEYVRLTDLTKLRIVRHILIDVMDKSLPERDQMTRWLADRIKELERV